ncbi:Uncharacterised protein [Catenibacterium mitsuokai]|nr:Uncharacterised protein [Catenibacterium mitsuokai]
MVLELCYYGRNPYLLNMIKPELEALLMQY